MHRPENPSPIVVYGDTTPECAAHITWLVAKLELLQKDRKVLAKVGAGGTPDSDEYRGDDDDDTPFDHFQHFCHTIADSAKEIWILDDGYKAFEKEYSFLCGHVDWNSMFPLPHQVNRNLFLGTRVFPLEKDCLAKLGITHIIVSEFQKLSWRELDGISVLRCSVKDENDQPMLQCWKACYQFITEALGFVPAEEQTSAEGQPSTETELPNIAALSISPPLTSPESETAEEQSTSSTDTPFSADHVVSEQDAAAAAVHSSSSGCGSVRILVLLHGRSRSSSVILAYLIKAYRMNFGQAWTYLCSKCWHIIDRSLVYVDQLKLWEQTELASIEEF